MSDRGWDSRFDPEARRAIELANSTIAEMTRSIGGVGLSDQFAAGLRDVIADSALAPSDAWGFFCGVHATLGLLVEGDALDPDERHWPMVCLLNAVHGIVEGPS